MHHTENITECQFFIACTAPPKHSISYLIIWQVIAIYAETIGAISDWLYSYILIILLLVVGLYFTWQTNFVQFRLVWESIRCVAEPKSEANSISAFQALMVSTAARVGVGNISGVSTAIILGGAGSIFWMWVITLICGASAFIESTLAQIYKKRAADGSSFGGPAYYIQAACNSRLLGKLFAVAIIVTYLGGFSMVSAFNIVSAFSAYSFFNPTTTPLLIGITLALLTALCIFGGGKRVGQISSFLVPLMAISYLAVAIIIVFRNIELFPSMVAAIFYGAFDFTAIFGGFAGSAIMHGIRRGLYSNEAGVGSAPIAAAAASVSHPVKQGLAQMLSVYIDTLVLCTATAVMLLCSGVAGAPELIGVPYVQAAVAANFGYWGIHFVTFSIFCFAFASILGSFFYAEANLKYLTKGTTSRVVLFSFRLVAVLIVCLGALLEFSVVWNTADVMMGLMALINLPVIMLLREPALRCLQDYLRQRRAGKEPVFKAVNIGLRDETDFWR